MSSIIYVDESGDLGWTFTAPYRAGGSSRHLTISAVCVPSAKKHIPKRVLKQLYIKFNWEASAEKKWVDMKPPERNAFAVAALKMCDDHPDIHLHTITVKKENVAAHIRSDENKLYNYMIGLCLLDCMGVEDHVTFVPDPRSIKVASGNSLHDYLQMELWFKKKVKTKLITSPIDSKNCKGIQFADMLAGLMQQRFEDRNFDHIKICVRRIRSKRAFLR